MSYTNYNHDYRRNKLAEPAQLVAAANLWTPTVDQKHMLGCIYETNQGDRFKYCKNGTTAIAKAYLIAAEAIDGDQACTVQTLYGADAGDTVFSILATTGSAISDDELVDGYLLVSDGGAAMGDLYTIKSNKWTTGDTVMQVTIADAGGLRNAIAATDDVSFFKNQCRDVIVKPGTLTSPMLGVTTTIIPISYYFWAKVKGVTTIIRDNSSTIVVGEPVGHIDGTTDIGCIGLVATAATDTVVGTCLFASANDEATLVNLQIPGM